MGPDFRVNLNDTVLPEVKVRRTGTGKNVVLPDSMAVNEPAARPGRRRSGPCQSSRSLSSALSLPASSRTALCFASAFPCFHQNGKRLAGLDRRAVTVAPAFLRAIHGLPRRLVFRPGPPAPGHRPDAFPCAPLSRAALPAASPQALRAIRAPQCSAYRLFQAPRALTDSFSPSGMERGMLARPRLRRSWRSRHRPPLRPHTGHRRRRPHCPPDHGHPGGAAPRPGPAPSALAAPPRQCPARIRVLCLVCIPLSVPPIPRLLSLCFQRFAALPAAPTESEQWQ